MRVTGAGVSAGSEKCENGDSRDIRALPFPGGFAEVGVPTGAARPAETAPILHDVIQACGCVRIGRRGSGGDFEGAGVSESGGGKGGLERAGVPTSPVQDLGSVMGLCRMRASQQMRRKRTSSMSPTGGKRTLVQWAQSTPQTTI